MSNLKSQPIILWGAAGLFLVIGIVVLGYSFSGGSRDAADEVNAIYTNAALTLAAQQQTLLAGIPSSTPTIGTTDTFTPFPSPTLGTLQPALFATSTLSSSGNVSLCDNSLYLADVTIPDNTAVNAGQTFTKTWKVSNTGTCTWTSAYQIILISGDAMGGKATAIGQAVAPGQSIDVSVALTAPSSAGTFTGTWRLQNDKAQPFGTLLTVVIKVGTSSGATVTTTNTTTSSGSNTSTPTATTAAATTAAPTNTTASTNTIAPTATDTVMP